METGLLDIVLKSQGQNETIFSGISGVMDVYLKREDSSRLLWTNPLTGWVEAVPRHTEIPNRLVRKMCKCLSIPEIG